MSAHPNTLGLLDRAFRLIEESNPPDESPLTTAQRDIREARAAVAELMERERVMREALERIAGHAADITGGPAMVSIASAALARVKGVQNG